MKQDILIDTCKSFFGTLPYSECLSSLFLIRSHRCVTRCDRSDSYLEEIYSQTHPCTLTQTLESPLEKYKPLLVYDDCNESCLALRFWHIYASFLHLCLFLLKMNLPVTLLMFLKGSTVSLNITFMCQLGFFVFP